MTLQLWLTAAVAIAGNVTVVVNGLLTARNAAKLAERLRTVDRRDARRKNFDESCQQFLVAARILRSPADAAQPSDQAALTELRRAVAGIELYGPEETRRPALAALQSFEQLFRLRAEGAWSDSLEAAETACDNALAAARAALVTAEQ